MRTSFLLLWWLAAVITPLYPVQAATGPLPIATLVKPNGIQSAVLSPDGKHLALIGFTGHNYGLMLLEIATMKIKTLVDGQYSDEGNFRYKKKPLRATWATNELIAVDFGYKAESVDLTGKTIAELGERVLGKSDHADHASPIMLAYTDAEDGDVAMINALTGAKTRFRLPMSGRQIAGAFDSKGNLRAVTMMNSAFWKDVTVISNWYRSSPTAQWEKLAEFGVTEDFWTPMTVPDEADSLVIRSRIGRDTYAVFEYDTARRRVGEMLAGHPTRDILSVSGQRDSLFRSVVTHGMVPRTDWFDPAWARMQMSVDAALPGKVNLLSGDVTNRVLVLSYSDRDPGNWYILDVATMRLRDVGRKRNAIDPAEMLPMETISYTAPDGMKIPAYLTRPSGAKVAGPAVVMIHGGPTIRDDWEWNQDVQFLASRGYAVLQPQFRGSAGFGRAFEVAGYGQWGRAMQDDVTAGVHWLVSQGIADPARICIYGASYGGYAALWGLANNPDLYKCGISFAGVSDIELMFHDWSDTTFDKVARQHMRAKVGDVRTDKAEFDLVSPLKQAHRIKAPVLLMHGTFDERVPLTHAKQMKRALESHKKPVEFVEFPEAGHGLTLVADKIRYLKKMEAFLARHIGAAAVSEPDTPNAGAQK